MISRSGSWRIVLLRCAMGRLCEAVVVDLIPFLQKHAITLMCQLIPLQFRTNHISYHLFNMRRRETMEFFQDRRGTVLDGFVGAADEADVDVADTLVFQQFEDGTAKATSDDMIFYGYQATRSLRQGDDHFFVEWFGPASVDDGDGDSFVCQFFSG